MNSCAFEGGELEKKKMHILMSSLLVKHAHTLMEQIWPFQLPRSTSAGPSRWICIDLDQASETKLTSAPIFELSESHRLPFACSLFCCVKRLNCTSQIFLLL